MTIFSNVTVGPRCMEQNKVLRGGNEALTRVLEGIQGWGVVAGGFARWSIVERPVCRPRDVDFFPFSADGQAEIVKSIEKNGGRFKRESPHALTYEGLDEEFPEIQVIRWDRFPGVTGREIVDQFALTVQRAYLESPEEGRAYDSLHEHERLGKARLCVRKPDATHVAVLLKYAEKGYHADEKEWLSYYQTVTALQEGDPWDADNFWAGFDHNVQEYLARLGGSL